MQRYERGHVVNKLAEVDTCDPNKHGTKVTFKPDGEIFDTLVYNYDTLKERLREMAFLTKGLKIILTDERESQIFARHSTMRVALRSLLST